MAAKSAPDDLVPYLQQMLDELDSGWLDVVLVPSRDHETAIRGGMIRVNQSINADWYRRLCRKYPSYAHPRRMKFDTRIKRRNARSTLKTLITGKKTPSYLVDFMLAEARDRLEQDMPPF